MPLLKVENVGQPKTYEGQYGTGYSYMVSGQVDGQPHMGTMSVKDQKNAPKIGDEIEVTIEETQYGTKFRRVNKNNGSFSGNRNDPEVRKEIIRQNALGHAVTLSIAKAQLIVQLDPDKAEEAFETISGKNIILTAQTFAKYSEGQQILAGPAKEEKNDNYPFDSLDDLMPLEKTK